MLILAQSSHRKEKITLLLVNSLFISNFANDMTRKKKPLPILENITITDDEEFYTPADFTAANVTYKRTFYKGCDADSAHWTTIMLPF